MTDKEKAKAWDDAIRKLRGMIPNWKRLSYNGKTFLQDLIHIFPELKESEDERIRIELTQNLKERFGTCGSMGGNLDMPRVLAWLEKQATPQVRTGLEWVNTIDDACDKRYSEEYAHGEYCHKQSFKWGFSEGVDWLEKQGETFTKKDVDDAYLKGVCDTKQELEKQGENHIVDNNEMVKPIDKVEPKFNAGDWVVVNDGRIGRIRECTKDFADVDLEFSCLSTSPNNIRSWTIQDAKDGDILATQDHILIFEKLLPKDGGESYCHYDFGCSKPQFDFNKDSNWYFGKEAKVYPATKEQRDQLEKAMADSGYTFDFDKKELKKIEQKPTEWSEKTKGLDELETYILSIVPNRPLDAIKVDSKNIRFLINKEQKPAWSEEDEYHKRQILRILKDNGCSQTLQERTEKWIEERLKSLRPQSQWKPSDEQMDALRYVTNFDYGGHKAILVSLYEQLKKLNKE